MQDPHRFLYIETVGSVRFYPFPCVKSFTSPSIGTRDLKDEQPRVEENGGTD